MLINTKEKGLEEFIVTHLLKITPMNKTAMKIHQALDMKLKEDMD